MTEYRYLFADLLTDQVLAELPLTGVSFNKELNAIGSFNGRLLLSDVRLGGLQASTTRTNLVTNPSFEVDTTGWSANAGSTVARTTADARFGGASCLVTQAGTAFSGIILTGTIAVTAGLQYTLSVYMRGVTSSQTLLLNVHQLNAGGAIVTQSNDGVITLTSSAGWSRYSVTFTAAATVVSVRPMMIHPSTATAGHQFYADAWLLEQESTLQAYFDGSTFGGTDLAVAQGWNGTPNNSTSYMTQYVQGVDNGSTAINDNTIPGRTALYVDRSGTIVWGGIVWGRSYSSVDQSIVFQAREFESYFEKRRINTTYTATAVDQFTVVKALVDQIQAVPSGSINVTVPTLTSGVLITKTYEDWEQKPLYEALLELSRSENGFDFNIDVSYDSADNFVKYLDLGYPRRGTAFATDATNIPVLELGGNVVEYDYPEDGGSVANTMHGVGSGSGEGKLLSTQSNAGQLADGWPVLEQSVSLTDYLDQTLLDQITLGHLNALLNPVVVMRVVTEAYNDPVLGSFKTGDDVRVRLTDPRFPDGYDFVRRIARFEVQPGEDGPERITFSLSIPPE